MDNIDKSEWMQNIIRVVKGSIAAIIITLICLFIFALLLTYTNIQENTIQPVIIVITAISILIGSSISTMHVKKKGFLYGSLVGIIYIVTIYLLSAVTGSGFSLSIYSGIMIGASIIAGMLGGMIGVNIGVK